MGKKKILKLFISKEGRKEDRKKKRIERTTRKQIARWSFKPTKLIITLNLMAKMPQLKEGDFQTDYKNYILIYIH